MESDDKKINSYDNIHKLLITRCTIAAIIVVLFYFLIKRYDGVSKTIAKIISAVFPIVLGFIIAFLLSPIMTFIENWLRNLLGKRYKRSAKIIKAVRIFSSIVSVLLFLAVIVIFLVSVIPQIVATLTYIYNNIDKQLQNVLLWANNITQKRFDSELKYAGKSENISSFIKMVKAFIADSLNFDGKNEMIHTITSSVIDVGKYLVSFLISLFAAIYFLIDKEKDKAICKKILFGLFPAKIANPIMETARKAGEIFYGFFVGKIIDSLIIGAICYICMLLFKMPYPVLVSVIVGVTNVIPVFGPYIGAVPSVTIIFFTDPMQGIYFLIFIIVLQQLDGNVIGPKILGDSTGVDAFWVLFAIVVGGGLFGFMGMLLGVPTVALIYYCASRTFRYLAKKRGLPTETSIYERVKCVNEETGRLEFNEKKNKKVIKFFKGIRKRSKR